MKVLVVGSGGREHAMTRACVRSPHQPNVTCLPGNAGTDAIARNISSISTTPEEITDFAAQEGFDLVVIGPEAPLVAGVVDLLESRGLTAFGPHAEAARLEGSKAFAKDLMREAGVPVGRYDVFHDIEHVAAFLSDHPTPVVVKASGLAAGKGAFICGTIEEAIAIAEAMLVKDSFGSAGHEIVVEEFLTGTEMSLLAVVDGTDFMLLPPARDHKRAYDNNTGPNTGGMGAFSPVPDIDDGEIECYAESIFPPVLRAMAERGTPYSGCLYAGIMITGEGPKVLEFNCRLGDPEAQVVLTLLAEDPLEIMLQTASGNLNDWMSLKGYSSYDWRRLARPGYATTVVAAAEGYPGNYTKGIPVTDIPEDTSSRIVFHAGTKLNDERILTDGGRVLSVTGLGNSMDESVRNAYDGIGLVRYEGVRYRTDIGRSSIRR